MKIINLMKKLYILIICLISLNLSAQDEVYADCAHIQELDTFLLQYNFTRVVTNWKGKTWGDAFYIKDFKKKSFIQNLVRRITCRSKPNE